MAQNISKTSIREAVIRELGTGATDLANEITRYQNQVLREIAQYYPWKWMEELPKTLSTDTNLTYITKPGYMGDITSIYQDSGGVEISRISETEYARLMSQSDTSSSLAVNFIEKGGRILFWPPLTAGSSVVVLFQIYPESLVDDSDTDTVEAIGDIVPASFTLAIEWGILRCLDAEEKKDAWARRYYNELEIKRKRAILADGPKVKGTAGPSIAAMNRHFSTN